MAAAEKLCQRAQRYNESVALAQDYARQGKAFIVAPDDTCGVDTLKKDKESLHRLYEKGYMDGKKITDYLSWMIHGSICVHKICRSCRYNHAQYLTLPEDSL